MMTSTGQEFLSLEGFQNFAMERFAELLTWIHILQDRITTEFLQSGWTCFSAALCIVAVTVITYYAYQILFVPLDLTHAPGETGYIPDGTVRPSEMAAKMRKMKQVGDVPPPYPNGWFAVMDSMKLKKGQVKYVKVLGLHLAVFRDDHGRSHILDAYCPHLGANLAVGGRVFGNCIECPFHGWKFRGEDGKCMEIPCAESVPEIARTRSWPVREVNGQIFIWHHAEGIEPFWEVPEVPEITSGTWKYGGRTEHYVSCHIEEIPENGADFAHFALLHESPVTASNDLRYMRSRKWSFIRHAWTGTWEESPAPESHTATMTLKQSLKLFGIRLSFLDIHVSARQLGPGFVHIFFESLFGRGMWFESVTPVEPLQQKFIHTIHADWKIPTFILKSMMSGFQVQSERDQMVWNHKRYTRKPLYAKCKEDQMLAKHRRWYSQFYSENSKKFSLQQDNLDW